jgi:hypothetical protein
VGALALIDEKLPFPPNARVAVPSASVCTDVPSSAIVAVDPPVKLTGALAVIVADQEVKALVEAEPLEELLLPPAHALIKIGKNTRAILFIINSLIFFILFASLQANGYFLIIVLLSYKPIY